MAGSGKRLADAFPGRRASGAEEVVWRKRGVPRRVDIGSTKVACVVARDRPRGRRASSGFGTAAPEVQTGVVINLDKAAQSVETAAASARRWPAGSQRPFRSLSGISGEHIKHLTGTAAVAGAQSRRAASVRAMSRMSISRRRPSGCPTTNRFYTWSDPVCRGRPRRRPDPLGLFGVGSRSRRWLVIGA